MISVSIGGFHHHKVRLFYVGGIFNQRLSLMSDIPGKDDFYFLPLFSHPHFNAGRTQKMPGVHKPHRKIFFHLHFFIVTAGNEVSQYPHNIIHAVQRHNFRQPGSFRLPVFPLCLKLLDMGTVL